VTLSRPALERPCWGKAMYLGLVMARVLVTERSPPDRLRPMRAWPPEESTRDCPPPQKARWRRRQVRRYGQCSGADAKLSRGGPAGNRARANIVVKGAVQLCKRVVNEYGSLMQQGDLNRFYGQEHNGKHDTARHRPPRYPLRE